MNHARRFTLNLTDGRIWHGVEFPSGHVAVNHPDEPTWFTIATSTEHLLADLHPEHPMHGARIQWVDGEDT